MIKIGLAGTENSHTDHFLRHLNTEQLFDGYRVVALAGGDSERNRALAETGGVEVIVDEASELAQHCDAVITSSRDGARHRGEAEPLLQAGIPVLVDKPLATSVADAQAIWEASQRGGAALVSCSAMRLVPGIAELKAAELGEVRQLDLIGPADPDSPYSGLFFYGIHHVEAALELLGNPEISETPDVSVTRRGDLVSASLQLGEVRLNLSFLTPSNQSRVPFAATLSGTDGVAHSQLTTGPDYNLPTLRLFIDAIENGSAKTIGTKEYLMAPITIMAAITAALPSAS